MPKKILLFSIVYLPNFVGGAEIAIKEITDRIDPGKLSFDMLTLRADKKDPSFERVGNINVYRIGPAFRKGSVLYRFNLWLFKYLFPFMASARADKMHKENNYIAIWSLMANYAGFAGSFFKKKNPEVPFILTLQEGDPLSYIKRRVGIFAPLFRKIFKRADIVQAISRYLGIWANDMGFSGIPEIIPNAVDLENFGKVYSGDELSYLEEKFEKTPEDIFIITTSRLVKKNAVDVVIEAMPLLSKNIKFLVIGNGEVETKLLKLATKLNVLDRVKFIGYVPHTEMAKYLRVSDIFVRPSRSEGLGNSFLEAFAAGLPVVATRVGGIPDFLQNGVNGFYAKVDDPKDLALKIKMLFGSEKLRHEMGEDGRKMVFEKYNWERITDLMIEKIFSPAFKLYSGVKDKPR